MKELQDPDAVFQTILGLVVRFAEHGLIHCDFNEFNIMVSFRLCIFLISIWRSFFVPAKLIFHVSLLKVGHICVFTCVLVNIQVISLLALYH